MSAPEFEVRQAADVVPTKRLAAIACVAVVVGFGCVIVSGYLGMLHTDTLRGGLRSYPAPPPPGTAERTLIETTDRGHDLENAQRRALETYGWVDRKQGIARIPIDRAMDLTAEESR